ncbi:MAG: BACON domain-containing protein, partial [Alistipes sp.]|nr:BACON domain-containing protein [Alistipes sp.]
MKIKNLFYLLLALPLVFAACNETPDVPPTPEAKPSLTLTSDAVLNFGAEGGEAEITYNLQNPVEGTELTVACEADWVEAVAGDKVRVTVAANEGEAREAKVVVAYGDLNFEVAVKQAAKAAKEYLYDEVLVYGERISLADYGFPDNYYLIGFYDESNQILLGVVIVGAEGESILSAGTYTAANGGLMMEGMELYIGETEEYFFEGGYGTIVVGGDIDGYTFDIELTNADAQNFHFTFEGVINGMNLTGNLPTEDVNMEATYLGGEYYGIEYSETYN